MLKRINYADLTQVLSRRKSEFLSRQKTVQADVQSIIDSVIERQDEAIIDWTNQFDGVQLDTFKVPSETLKKAYDSLAPNLQKALQNAYDSIASYHTLQTYTPLEDDQQGLYRAQKITPLDSVGLYVPGGTAAYPSSVLMNAVPAKIAGVKRIAMVTPPHPDGISATVLAAAYLCDIDAVYQVGGVQAIAALAYGTQQIPAVAKIVGPGNLYVATAKHLLSSVVGIDQFAGPSEVCIWADHSVPVSFIAADLIAQAEHDPLAQSIVMSDDEAILDAIDDELSKQVKDRSRHSIIVSSLKNYGLSILLEDKAQGPSAINQIAPEHLELLIQKPRRVLSEIRHAGAIFLGPYTPEAMGDYMGGPNHTLPTSGTATFASGLSTYDFLKRTSILEISEERFTQMADDVEALALEEHLDGHAESVRVRRK